MTHTDAAERFVTLPATAETIHVGALIAWPTWSGHAAEGVVVDFTARPCRLAVRASDGHVDRFDWIPTDATVTTIRASA